MWPCFLTLIHSVVALTASSFSLLSGKKSWTVDGEGGRARGGCHSDRRSPPQSSGPILVRTALRLEPAGRDRPVSEATRRKTLRFLAHVGTAVCKTARPFKGDSGPIQIQ